MLRTGEWLLDDATVDRTQFSVSFLFDSWSLWKAVHLLYCATTNPPANTSAAQYLTRCRPRGAKPVKLTHINVAREYIRVVLMAINFPKEDLRLIATSCERIDNTSFYINRSSVDTRCGMNMQIPGNGPFQSDVSFFLACLLFYSRKEQTKQHINQHISLSGSTYRTVTKQPSHDLVHGIGCPCLLSSELTQRNV